MAFGDIFKSKEFKRKIEELEQQNAALIDDNKKLNTDCQKFYSDNVVMSKTLSEIGGLDYIQVKERISQAESEYRKKIAEKETEHKKKLFKLNQQSKELKEALSARIEELNQVVGEADKLSRQNKTQYSKLNRTKELAKAIEHSLKNYFEYEPSQQSIKQLTKKDWEDLENINPSVILKLHCMDVKDLRKAYRANDKQISKTLEKYSARYTTKANQAIYKLMVIALRAELQNVLFNLKYEKLDQSVNLIKDISQKYLKIAGEGNQNIVGTLTKFIGEIEYLFINAVKIEYNYYVKKEQAKQEQMAIREQMRQEAAEKKALEQERKRIEKEEEKYNAEIEKLKIQLADAHNETLEALNARIIELQSQLSNVIIQKEEIARLSTGKAGNVYIISNLGSFGENVFKIGMTRRLDPQERVNELGDASVPFKFDVHSFIFSDNAVDLERALHDRLNDKRVNKVNLRKEFFYTTIDELEELTTEIEPTAEFNKTMLAEQFRQSQSSDFVYTSDYVSNYLDEDDE